MSILSATGLSGMLAAQDALDASARRIAGMAGIGLQRASVAASAPDGAATTSVAPAQGAGQDLQSDVVGELVAKNAFLANLAVFKTSEQMTGTLLDTLG